MTTQKIRVTTKREFGPNGTETRAEVVRDDEVPEWVQAQISRGGNPQIASVRVFYESGLVQVWARENVEVNL